MKPSEHNHDTGNASASAPLANDEATGLPVFHTWRSVYVLVLSTFVFWVVLLWLLSAHFR